MLKRFRIHYRRVWIEAQTLVAESASEARLQFEQIEKRRQTIKKSKKPRSVREITSVEPLDEPVPAQETEAAQ
jgi:hypothetical protein